MSLETKSSQKPKIRQEKGRGEYIIDINESVYILPNLYFFFKNICIFKRILLHLRHDFYISITINYNMYNVLEVLVAYLFVPNELILSVAHPELLLFGVCAMFIYLLSAISATVKHRYIYKLYRFIHFIPYVMCCPLDIAAMYPKGIIVA